MTDEEWSIVEEELVPPFGFVKLLADGYDVTITVGATDKNRMKYGLMVLVDNKFKIEWMDTDCEIRRKFCRRHSKCYIKPQYRKKVSKKELEENTVSVYVPLWSSFKLLKSHLKKNCESIVLKKAGYTQFNQDRK